MFNATWFETFLTSNSMGFEPQRDVVATSKMVPGSSFPFYWDTIAETNLSLNTGFGSVLPATTGLALGYGNRSLEEYLDWQNLGKAYNDAYQLLFARAMVDVLDVQPEATRLVQGQQKVKTEAVVLEAIFVHIVAGLLGVVSVATIVLLALSCIRQRKLHVNPSTIASIMTLVADSEPLLSDLASMDCCKMEDIQRILGPKRYMLSHDDSGAR